MKKYRVVISGYYGFQNAGDEAMLTAILESLYEQLPDLEITVISGNPKETREKHGVHAVSRLNFPHIMTVLQRCDMLISGGGSLLQDVTSKRSLYYYLSIMRLAKWLGKKVFLYAQGIGPLHKPQARKTVAEILNTVDAITVRDQASARLLRDLGVHRPPIHVTADAVLAMHRSDVGVGRMLLQNAGVEGAKPRLGVAIRQWQKESHFKVELAQIFDRLISRDIEIVFLPMHYPEDVQAAEEVVSYMQNIDSVHILRAAYTTSEMMGIIGNMDVVLGIRLHALIFAALMNIPLVGISYDPKIDSFLATIGETSFGNIHHIESAALEKRLADILETREMPPAQKEVIAELSRQAESTASMAVQILTQEGGR